MTLFGGQSKLAPELMRVDGSKTIDVIIQYKSTPTEAVHERVVALGGSVRARFPRFKSGSYSIRVEALSRIEKDPNVLHISLDHPVRSLLDLTAAAVKASSAWNSGSTGKGIGVAVIDSGISTADDLDSRIIYKQDFVGGGTDDRYGHGEHVAGIIAGSGKDSICSNCTRTFKGIAPQANLLDLRVLDQNGNGTDTTVIAAINEAISLKSKYNVRVINLSLGRPVYESYTQDPLCQAVEAAWNAGIVVIAAAGNSGRDNSAGTSGYGTIYAPGNDPYVITVGAMKTEHTPDRGDDLIASYSSKGPTMIDHIVKPDIVAPGNQVDSLLASTSHFGQSYPKNVVPLAYYQNTNQTNPSNKYFTLSGTSMAAPVVSGAAADLLQVQPSLTPDQVKAKMMLTAYKTFPATSTATDPATGNVYTSEYDLFTIGAGYLDMNALFADQTLPAGTARSPVAAYDPGSGNVYINALTSSDVWNSQSLWGTRAVWHTSGPAAFTAVWGTNAVFPDQSVWGSRAVWKTSSASGFSVVWGASSVWGQSGDATEAASVAFNGEQ